jgi:hypothetical protein
MSLLPEGADIEELLPVCRVAEVFRRAVPAPRTGDVLPPSVTESDPLTDELEGDLDVPSLYRELRDLNI